MSNVPNKYNDIQDQRITDLETAQFNPASDYTVTGTWIHNGPVLIELEAPIVDPFTVISPGLEFTARNNLDLVRFQRGDHRFLPDKDFRVIFNPNEGGGDFVVSGVSTSVMSMSVGGNATFSSGSGTAKLDATLGLAQVEGATVEVTSTVGTAVMTGATGADVNATTGKLRLTASADALEGSGTAVSLVSNVGAVSLQGADGVNLSAVTGDVNIEAQTDDIVLRAFSGTAGKGTAFKDEAANDVLKVVQVDGAHDILASAQYTVPNPLSLTTRQWVQDNTSANHQYLDFDYSGASSVALVTSGVFVAPASGVLDFGSSEFVASGLNAFQFIGTTGTRFMVTVTMAGYANLQDVRCVSALFVGGVEQAVSKRCVNYSKNSTLSAETTTSSTFAVALANDDIIDLRVAFIGAGVTTYNIESLRVCLDQIS